MDGKIAAICLSDVSGLPRPQVKSAELKEELGFVGNKHSVGGDREVCLFDIETYAKLTEDGINVYPGSFGENIVTEGILLANVKKGDHLVFGCGAEIEITIPRTGCANLKQLDDRLPEAIKGRSGWMAKVIYGGVLRPGDTISVLQ